ncbi:helix-turn-helix transcriptional regulator [Rapidithrix thailandica]|uniref:Helix-turn-helix transcriptional regulator n=1 Tax=Rapidithrix thailandica TaxID=413964 RepID=A0AAW9S5I8_9BACT
MCATVPYVVQFFYHSRKHKVNYSCVDYFYPEIYHDPMTREIETKDKSNNSQSIQISPFRKHIRKTKPHLHHNYFEVIYLSKGTGFHTIDHQKFKVIPPVLFFIRKEQVHHWELTSEPEGYVMILKKSFLEQSLDQELKALLSEISNLNCIELKDSSTIENLLKIILSESASAGKCQFTILEGLLKAFFAKVASYPKTRPGVVKPKEDLFHAFRELLNNSETVKNNIAYYAEVLNTTPQNLNQLCRKNTGKAATKVIAGYIIHEAKRLLIYTALSVAEIAFSLNFKDPSHFVKYFKRHVGTTPQSFRNSQE